MTGFARPKTSGSWVAQMIAGAATVALVIAFTSSDLGMLAIGALVGGLLALAWIEFEARCENRTVVLLAGTAIIGLSTYLIAHNRNRQE